MSDVQVDVLAIGSLAKNRYWNEKAAVRNEYATTTLVRSGDVGYVRTRSGRWLAFSILINDVPWGHVWRARLAQDKMCIRLVEE